MVAQAVGFWRLPSDAPIWSEPGVVDPTSGPEAPHYEVLFGDGYVHALPPPNDGNYYSAVTVNLAPSSRGAVTLASNDPFGIPIINPNLLGTKEDVYVSVQGKLQCSVNQWPYGFEGTMTNLGHNSFQESSRVHVQAYVQRLCD